MTLVSSYGFLPIVGAVGVSVDVSRVAGKHCGRSDRRQRRSCASVRLAGAEEITVREIDLKRQEGSSVKIVLYIAMPRHFDKADFLRLQEDIPGVQSVEI